MPKNKGKGGKNRRRGKNDNDGEKKELQFKEDGQEYAQVLRMLGHGRLEAHCFDGVKRLCHIRGKMRKRVWVNGGDIVLVSLRDYQDRKGDIIAKYTPDEARCLKTYGEIPSNAKINDNDLTEEKVNDVGIEFLEEESIDESDNDSVDSDYCAHNEYDDGATNTSYHNKNYGGSFAANLKKQTNDDIIDTI